MRINHSTLIHCALFLAVIFLTACGGGGGGTPATATTTYTIGGSVSGLTGTGLVLQNNGSNGLPVSADGSFTFTTALASGAAYSVTVSVQPTGQTCAASNNTGTVSGANVTTVSVSCADNIYTVSGTVTGLVNTGLRLQNNANASDELTIAADGTFPFAIQVAHGANYAVTVTGQPADQRCTVTNGTGIATANVNVTVSCGYTISANVTGFSPSIGLVLQNNGGDNLSITGDGISSFSQGVANGSYNVTVLIQPTAPARTCAVSGSPPASGTVTGGPVTVTINCGPPVPVFAYVANSGSGDVSVYQIGTGTGVLSSGTAVLAGTVPQSVTVDPTGRFAYVANQGVTDGFGVSAGDISAYTIGGGGALTPVNCGSGPGCNGANFQAGNNTKSVIVDPSGKFVYAVNLNSSDISAYTIDNAPTTGTGALTSVGATVATGLKPSSITVDHTGKFAYVANADENSVSAYTINATTGALTQILCSVVGGVCETVLSGTGDNFLAGAGPQSVTVDPTSKFVYVANATDNTVSAYSIDAVSGVLTPIDAIPSTVGVIDNFAAGTTPTSVAVDPSGNYAYVANNGSGDVSAYAITTTGPTAGALSPIACVTSATIACSASNFFTAGMGPTSIAVDLLGQAVYVANITSNDISAYTITTGGVLAFIDAAPGGAIDNFPAGNAPASVTTATIQ